MAMRNGEASIGVSSNSGLLSIAQAINPSPKRPCSVPRARSASPAMSYSGETFEVQCQVAFMRKSYRVRNGGEGAVRCGKQQLGSLNSTLDDILVAWKAN